MLVVAMSDSDSAEAANLRARLSDAVDPQFERFFDPKCKSHKIENVSTQEATSFRNQMYKNNVYDNLGTTQEFRDHVAKKLSEIIDRKVKLTKQDGIPSLKSKLINSGGIRLFASSVTCIDMQSTVGNVMQRKRPFTRQKRKKVEDSTSSSSEDLEKLASVAVSSEWVLSKKGLYCEKNDKTANEAVVVEKGCITSTCSSTKALASAENGMPVIQHRSMCQKKKSQHKDVNSNYELKDG